MTLPKELQVDRYDLVGNDSDVTMCSMGDGDYVMYLDYAKLKAYHERKVFNILSDIGIILLTESMSRNLRIELDNLIAKHKPGGD